MSLVVTVKKLDGCFFPGDTFRCVIEFHNRQIDGNQLEGLAWASAQIHGQYVVDPGLIKLPSSTQQRPLTGSTLPKLDNGRIMYCSNAEILVCDLKLKPQETKTVIYSCTIPTDSLPPSFSGSSIKYSNILTIACQKSVSPLAGPPVLLTIPFRLLNPSSGLRRHEIKLGCPTFKCTTSIKELTTPTSILEARPTRIDKPVKDKETRRVLKAIFEKYGKPVCINVNKGNDRIVDFTLEKTVYQLGDLVRGYLDFSAATLPSYHLSMKLVSIEEVSSEYYANHPGKPSSSFSKVIAESEEVVHHTLSTHFEFYIPISATPTFATELISFRWALKFQLVSSKDGNDRQGELNINYMPQEDQLEKMTWQIPIKVLVASHPTDLIDDQKKFAKSIVC